MSNLEPKAAYLKGLADGMKLADSDVNNLIKSMVDFLGEVAETVDGLDGEVEFLADNLEDVDSELDEIDKELDEIAEILSDCSECDGECDHDFDFSDECFEVTCPACNQIIKLNMEALDDDEAKCPLCGEEMEFDFDFEE